jgi:thiol:disulfide interchange protein DsbD
MRECSQRHGFSWALTAGVALLLCAVRGASGAAIPHGTLELVAENSRIDKQGIAAGRTFDVGLRFQLEKGWHIYWINPGDSGEPPRVEWHLPAGLTAGAIEWPTPRRLESGTIVDYGYEDAVLLIVPMHADASLAAQQTAHLGATAKVLVCSHEMCIPGKAELSLTLPIQSQPPAADARTDNQTRELFAAARKSLPRSSPANWSFSVSDTKDSFVLTANLGHQTTGRQVTRAIFFPLAESQIDNAAPQKLQTFAAGFRLTLRKSDQLLKPIARLKGVLVLSSEPPSKDLPSSDRSSDRGYLIDVSVSAAGARHAVQ